MNSESMKKREIMFLSNSDFRNHLQEISALIEQSEECILCTCWLDHEALDQIEPYIRKRKFTKKVKIYSDGRRKHVPIAIRERLKKNPRVEHFFAKRGKRLHSKIYYFSTGESYKAIVGSANLTGRGLSLNDEFSVLISGKKSSDKHKELVEYLRTIEVSLKTNT